jgi:1-deoxy-D-xylulose-5-phosphate reductoisomerase
MPKRVIILGSTGSIGCNALSVADNLPDEFEIVGLAADSRWRKLAEQVQRHHPRVAVLSDPEAAENLVDQLGRSSGTAVWSGPEALLRLVKEVPCDFVLAGIVGVAGLPATLAAIERGLTVGLANKESLVVAGELMVKAAAASGSRLLPVDSEHSAIYQSLLSGRRDEIERIFLTASGGPFRTWTAEQMKLATLADAMRHPTWNMGPKITVDSATMMNKALEIIEARWLFDVDPSRIEVVIHPESIIHSMVAFRDGSIVAQMGRPDMRTPIQYAMTHPRRLNGCGERLDFSQLLSMHFEPPDPHRFPSLPLGHQAAHRGGTAGAALNAANEAAVEAFRAERLGFADIVPLVEEVVNRHLSDRGACQFVAHPDLETLMTVDAWARREISQCCPV